MDEGHFRIFRNYAKSPNTTVEGLRVLLGEIENSTNSRDNQQLQLYGNNGSLGANTSQRQRLGNPIGGYFGNSQNQPSTGGPFGNNATFGSIRDQGQQVTSGGYFGNSENRPAIGGPFGNNATSGSISDQGQQNRQLQPSTRATEGSQPPRVTFSDQLPGGLSIEVDTQLLRVPLLGDDVPQEHTVKIFDPSAGQPLVEFNLPPQGAYFFADLPGGLSVEAQFRDYNTSLQGPPGHTVTFRQSVGLTSSVEFHLRSQNHAVIIEDPRNVGRSLYDKLPGTRDIRAGILWVPRTSPPGTTLYV